MLGLLTTTLRFLLRTDECSERRIWTYRQTLEVRGLVLSFGATTDKPYSGATNRKGIQAT